MYRISSVIRQRFFFPFQNNSKNLDPSYKMESSSLGLFRKGKTCIIAKFHRTDLVIQCFAEAAFLRHCRTKF